MSPRRRTGMSRHIEPDRPVYEAWRSPHCPVYVLHGGDWPPGVSPPLPSRCAPTRHRCRVPTQRAARVETDAGVHAATVGFGVTTGTCSSP